MPAVEAKASSHAMFTGHVSIECGDDHNRQFLFMPTQQRLRGWWKRVNLNSDQLTELTQQIPDLPGLIVTVDTRRKTCSVIDPLNHSKHAETLAKLQRIWKAFMKETLVPEKDVTNEPTGETFRDDTRIKSWLYWMRRLVDNKQAVIIDGTMPKFDEIAAMPGKTMVGEFNNNHNRLRYRENKEHHERLLETQRQLHLARIE